jgi:DNA invertase Pin-like site-specific DNA recombinase
VERLPYARQLCRKHYRQAMSRGGKPGHTAPGKGKLTEEQRQEVLKLLEQGLLSKAQIARQFGVSRAALHKIQAKAKR